jgi:cobalt/nickel transport system permease protein
MRLIPFFSFPLFIFAVSEIPLMYLFKKLLIASIFGVAVGLANPFLDKSPMVELGGVMISGGWISFLSILIRFVLTASVALFLLGTTGLREISLALEGMGVPRVFTIQLFSLCRHLFLVSDEAVRISQARASRTIGKKGNEFLVSVKLLRTVLVRSFDRAERVYVAMKSRGYNGSMPSVVQSSWRVVDTFFLIVWLALFLFFRFVGFQ